ncbi:MAG: glucosaminidase domain-containing protein [Nanoarchaeota archaeon]|nr:glucosaminidase domain-containing protein [Nanoarchaeota archaeon]MBU1322100.1 glucosaminidase domain-containing protein [Nanoarchaeota archaeon]MBU1597918.1 glucosaminidase domain-containing protein [Nanoarchaeota archaeon]MBU2442056.1 glucosaminidase domain-containing protein [Nanoarchaeota archaeon]
MSDGAENVLGKIFTIVLIIFVIIALILIVFPGSRKVVQSIFVVADDNTPIDIDLGVFGSENSGESCNDNALKCKLTVMHSPSLSAAEVEKILKDANSPAIIAEPDIASFFVSESERTGIDNAIALAFFRQESSFGKAGKASTTKSIGNIRYTNTCKTKYSGTNYEGFCSYPTWKRGVQHWFDLIKNNYVGEGLTTVGDILVKYAPCSENSLVNYVASIKSFVDKETDRDVNACVTA